jgi:hypothetical protein
LEQVALALMVLVLLVAIQFFHLLHLLVVVEQVVGTHPQVLLEVQAVVVQEEIQSKLI